MLQIGAAVALYADMAASGRDTAISAALSAGMLSVPPLDARLEVPPEVPPLLAAIFDRPRGDPGPEVTMAEVLAVLGPLRAAVLAGTW